MRFENLEPFGHLHVLRLTCRIQGRKSESVYNFKLSCRWLISLEGLYLHKDWYDRGGHFFRELIDALWR